MVAVEVVDTGSTSMFRRVYFRWLGERWGLFVALQLGALPCSVLPRRSGGGFVTTAMVVSLRLSASEQAFKRALSIIFPVFNPPYSYFL